MTLPQRGPRPDYAQYRSSICYPATACRSTLALYGNVRRTLQPISRNTTQVTAAVGDEKLKLSEASRLCGIGVRTLKLLSCRLPAFAAHPLESAEVLGPHAGEPVVFEDVADVVFTKYVGPDVGQHPPKLGGRLHRPSVTRSGRPSLFLSSL